jgi:DNA-binding transcriptional ArsR family regulator
LRDAGLVNHEREGKFIFYSLNYNKLDHISQAVKNFLDTQ